MSDAAPQGRLAQNIVYFARALRAAGIPVGPGSVLDALNAVTAAGVGTREDFYWTLHAVFVKRHEHSVLYDQAFRLFFRKRAFLDKLLAMLSPQAPGGAPEPPQAGASRVQEALFAGMDKKQPPEEREVELDAAVGVLQQRGDAIALAQAKRDERMRQTIGRLVERLEGDGLVAADESDIVRIAADRTSNLGTDIHSCCPIRPPCRQIRPRRRRAAP